MKSISILTLSLMSPILYAQSADSVGGPLTNSLGVNPATSNTVTVGTNQQCRTPFGTVIGPGQKIIAYYALESTPSAPCVSEVRTCNNGVLSGSYQHQMCTVIEPPEPPPPPPPPPPHVCSYESNWRFIYPFSESISGWDQQGAWTRSCTAEVWGCSYYNNGVTFTEMQHRNYTCQVIR